MDAKVERTSVEFHSIFDKIESIQEKPILFKPSRDPNLLKYDNKNVIKDDVVFFKAYLNQKPKKKRIVLTFHNLILFSVK